MHEYPKSLKGSMRTDGGAATVSMGLAMGPTFKSNLASNRKRNVFSKLQHGPDASGVDLRVVNSKSVSKNASQQLIGSNKYYRSESSANSLTNDYNYMPP